MVARSSHCNYLLGWLWEVCIAKGVSNRSSGFLDLYRRHISWIQLCSDRYRIYSERTVILFLKAQMSIAAVAHIFVFPVEPYRLIKTSDFEGCKFQKEITSAFYENENAEGNKEYAAVRMTEEVESPRRSIKENVQDIVIGGGEHVLHDVLVTVSHVVEPVEKGVTKINAKLHHLSRREKKDEKEKEIVEHISKTMNDDDDSKIRYYERLEIKKEQT